MFEVKMNYIVFALFLSGLVASQSADKNETLLPVKNDMKPIQTVSVLEESDDHGVDKSQQKRELYEDDEETQDDFLLEKQSPFLKHERFTESEEIRAPLYYKDKMMADKRVPYKSYKSYIGQKPYSYLAKPYAVEMSMPYPVPVPREEYEAEFSHPEHLYSRYDIEDERFPKEPLGGKYHKIVAAHYGEYNPYEDMPVFRESEHILPGYLYHLHMKHQGVGGLYENRDSFEYGSGYFDESLPSAAIDKKYHYGYSDIPKLDRRSHYILVDGRMLVNPDTEPSYLEEISGLKRTSGFGMELPKSSRFPHYKEVTRSFYPGQLLESMEKSHLLESRQVRPTVQILSEMQGQRLGGNCQRSELKTHEPVVTSPSSSLFSTEDLFHRTEQQIKQKSAGPEVTVKLHQTLVALKKAEEEKAAIDHELHHIHHETDAKLQHGLQALEKANQEKHIIEEAVHHNIMQKENNDVKLHQSLSALKLAEHQKQAIELQLHKTQMEKEAKIKQELAALKKAEEEKRMIEQQLHKIAEDKKMLEHKEVLKDVKPENEKKTFRHQIEQGVPTISSKTVLTLTRQTLPAVPIITPKTEMTLQLNKEPTNVPKEDPVKKQVLASLLKQSSLIIGAIKEDKNEKKDEELTKNLTKM